ncbi:WD40/YVTN/BNR-like repeat-containing protein [Croceivirga sp. JEA036]|uniref:WD40/YVTN/BNR-like repeat-containing protein n=1 Tax=Croceivirga sp. JEA036 TaxID=2721162 RepID=UPI001439D03F|nr:oxidoreductase [Croceivirga sp. JEA036]NJB37955.1 oxidoreductase [Croceivirga sp. JEA036]
MKNSIALFLIILLLASCKKQQAVRSPFKSVKVEVVYKDSSSIRAITFLDKNTLAFAGSNGLYGTYTLPTAVLRSNRMQFDSIAPEFRAIAHNTKDFFMMSVGSPALLYKTGTNGEMDLVYSEEGENVFYDAMAFWNSEEGIAVGDTSNGCLAILITRNGGASWSRVACTNLPKAIEEEGAYAASNSNIVLLGDTTLVATTKRFLKSVDKGKTWTAIETPIKGTTDYHGMYSMDFYNASTGFVIGGDFAQPEGNAANKALTKDGGNTWQLVADGKNPGYKSCVQFVPHSDGKELVSVGFNGINYSADQGHTWKTLSEEGFYTLRFLNDSIAYAAGKGRIAKLSFKQ